MDTQLILNYLTDLSMNNNREWYHANKDAFKKANAEFESLLDALILEIGTFDSSILQNSPKDLTFKIVRDTRFSHDKSPYNPRPHFLQRKAAGACRLLPDGKARGPVIFRRRLIC